MPIRLKDMQEFDSSESYIRGVMTRRFNSASDLVWFQRNCDPLL
jgi:hypothetical protein